jgi:hypothetical protein
VELATHLVVRGSTGPASCLLASNYTEGTWQ